MRCGRWGSGSFGCAITGRSCALKLAREELPRALRPRWLAEFTAVFKGLGFKFVTLDLEGFRSGSMNQLLTTNELLRGRA